FVTPLIVSTRGAIKTTLEEPCALARGALSRLENSTKHADVGADGRGFHAHGEGRDLEGALADRAAHRLEDVRRLMLRDRSAYDDHARIEHVDETDGDVRERALRTCHDGDRALLAARGRRIHLARILRPVPPAHPRTRGQRFH